jgi:hypothetical protein
MLHRDPDGPRAPQPPVVPHTRVLRDAVAIEPLSGHHSYEGRRESMSDPSPGWRAHVEAALLCAGGPLVRGGRCCRRPRAWLRGARRSRAEAESGALL